jgi:hypothetical protein
VKAVSAGENIQLEKGKASAVLTLLDPVQVINSRPSRSV